jgi:hypothetical protein
LLKLARTYPNGSRLPRDIDSSWSVPLLGAVNAYARSAPPPFANEHWPAASKYAGAPSVVPVLGWATDRAGSAAHTAAHSMVMQSALQPSPDCVLPSSHVSGPTASPSPQTAGVNVPTSPNAPDCSGEAPRTITSTGTAGAVARSTSTTLSPRRFWHSSSDPGSAQSA